MLAIQFYLCARLLYLIAFEGKFSPTPVDEAIAVILIPCALMFFANMFRFGRAVLATSLLLLYVVSISVGYFVVGRFIGITFSNAMIAIILELKFVLILTATIYLVNYNAFTERNLEFFFKTIVWLSIFNSFFVLRDFISITDIYGQTLGVRSGWITPNGILGHKTPSAQLHFLGFIASLCLVVRKPSLGMQLICISNFILTILHQGAKETVCAIIVSLYFLSKIYDIPAILKVLFGVIALTISLAALSNDAFEIGALERVSFYLSEDGDDSARRRLLAAGMQIASEHFPFGTGAGSFGSEPSRNEPFSPVYGLYNINGFGMDAQNSSFLMDGLWHKVLGEGGVFGAFCLAAFLILITYCFRNRSRADARLLKNVGQSYVYFYFGIILLVIISSFASPILSSEMISLPFAIACAFLLNSYQKSFGADSPPS
ncbi:MAG: hypothetical protein O9256_01580 [Rhizobiaceae bacterium]|nr:hypothetical protein [Rhizobiaceae bacterium]MCZ8351793.1 hypothetical protein [Rhizobium sp.]